MKKKNNSDHYFESFGLTKDPFPIDSYDNILFLTPELTNRIQQVKKLIAETDKLIVVSSVSGAGKSSIADYLESIKEKNWNACLVQAESDMDRETLSYEIIQQVSPDKADEKGLSIPQLHKFLEFSSKMERIPVFIIDDADKLPLVTLEFILELSALKYKETCYHFVLFANEAITDKLNSENLIELTSQLVTSIHLPALSLGQLKEYIDNRLGSSGEIKEYPFSEADIEEIYRISAGLPKGINFLAREKMLQSLSPESNPSNIFKISAAVIIIIVLAVGYYMNGFEDEIEDQTQAMVAASDQPIPAPTAVPPPAELTIAEQDNLTASVTDVTVDETPEPVVETEQSTELMIDDALAEEITDASEFQESELTVDASDSVMPEENNFPESLASSQQQEPVIIETPEPEIIENIIEETPASDQQPESIDNIAVETSLPANDTSSEIDENIYKLDSIPEQLRGLRGENWYRDQARNSYVLQLISASELSNLLSLLEGLEDFHEDMSGYIKYTPSGRPRYLLFFGHYTDRESAINSASSIPEKLRSITPYPRSIGSILDEIEEVGYWPR